MSAFTSIADDVTRKTGVRQARCGLVAEMGILTQIAPRPHFRAR